SRLKNSMTPSTSSPSEIGKPNAACKPHFAATGARGNCCSLTTFEIQPGAPDSQILPGKPPPRAKVDSRVQSSKARTFTPDRSQESTHLNPPPSRTNPQMAPKSQRNPSQTACKILGAADSSCAESAKAWATAYCTIWRWSACLRAVMS